ncbi:H-X9-DG-CTERM domain-containing protein [Stratiformator vulcanicus]|nr:H-X9-DG-CTERM domain-containing protein [Stratiformator vulcanicus]
MRLRVAKDGRLRTLFVPVLGGAVCFLIAGWAVTGIAERTALLAFSSEDSLENRFELYRQRMYSQDKLTAIGKAITRSNRQLPPGGVFDSQARDPRPWTVHVLHDLAAPPVSRRARQISEDLLNATRRDNFHKLSDKFQEQSLPVYRIDNYEPTGAAEPSVMHFAANAHFMGADRSVSLRPEDARSANKLLVGEVRSNFQPWHSQRNFRDPLLGINSHTWGFGSPWQDFDSSPGCQFLMTDGSVRFISEDIDPDVLRQLSVFGKRWQP